MTDVKFISFTRNAVSSLPCCSWLSVTDIKMSALLWRDVGGLYIMCSSYSADFVGCGSV